MIILGTEELKQAESVLKQSFPESIKVCRFKKALSTLLLTEKVYGCIFHINRGKPHNLEVIGQISLSLFANFTKKVQGTKDREGDLNIYSIYSKSKDSLKDFLNTPGVINKDAVTLLAGVDFRHLEAVQEFGLPWKVEGVMNILLLQDEGQLQFKEKAKYYLSQHRMMLKATVCKNLP